jgi:hypothetical protein
MSIVFVALLSTLPPFPFYYIRHFVFKVTVGLTLLVCNQDSVAWLPSAIVQVFAGLTTIHVFVMRSASYRSGALVRAVVHVAVFDINSIPPASTLSKFVLGTNGMPLIPSGSSMRTFQ